MSDNETTQHRPRRLRLHGPHALQRVSAGAALLRSAVQAGAEGASARATRERAKAFAANWGYESVETDWRTLVERKDIDLIDIASPNDTHAEIAIAAAQGRQDGDVREAARRAPPPRPRRWSPRSRRPSVPNMVWYNYRRVPAVMLAQAADRRGQARADLPLPREVPAGLDDLRRICRRAARACGGSTSTVAGSGVTGDLLAHCIDTALWLNGSITEVTAMTETFIKERKHNLTGKVEPVGIDDASAFLCRFENGSLGDVRVDALRARAQGALHARDQRRARLGRSGICTTCTACSSSTTRTRAACAAGAASTSPTAITRT